MTPELIAAISGLILAMTALLVAIGGGVKWLISKLFEEYRTTITSKNTEIGEFRKQNRELKADKDRLQNQAEEDQETIRELGRENRELARENRDLRRGTAP